MKSEFSKSRAPVILERLSSKAFKNMTGEKRNKCRVRIRSRIGEAWFGLTTAERTFCLRREPSRVNGSRGIIGFYGLMIVGICM